MQAQQRAAAVAFQSPKYIQQAGALSHVGAFARECFPAAQRAALILSARSRAQHGEALCASLPSPLIAEFSGECSRAALASLVAKLAAHELSYVVGFGGGKLLDMAKLVRCCGSHGVRARAATAVRASRHRKPPFRGPLPCATACATHTTWHQVAHELDLPVVVVPSLASTDAPCTALSVVYSDAGA
jgi:glycerol dehydrogenase